MLTVTVFVTSSLIQNIMKKLNHERTKNDYFFSIGIIVSRKEKKKDVELSKYSQKKKIGNMLQKKLKIFYKL